MSFTENDKLWMQRALSLARKGEGYVSPNPLVGCVIVSESGNLVGEGYHERFGQAHAEVNAVQSVADRKQLTGATLYVTLEPCSHHGKTPPCCEMLAKLPLKRVVAAMKDPDPRVNGKGLAFLEQKGIPTDVGLLSGEARKVNEFFLHYQEHGRPFVTLKIAQTADGYIAAPNGDSKWITGLKSRTTVHHWRSRYDAVVVGRNTAMLDNPSLSVRHIEGRQPFRVVIDGPYELPKHLNLFSDQYEEKTIVVTYNREKAATDSDPMLKVMQPNYFRGRVLFVEKENDHCDLRQTLDLLGNEGLRSLLVEGGQTLGSAFLRNGLVDKIELFIAPKLLGGGTRSLLGLGINRMEELLPLRDVTWKEVGEDMLMTAYL